MSRPVYLNYSPQPDFIGALLDAPIFFRVEDSHGLNLSTFIAAIEGVDAILNGVFQPGFSGAITPEDHIPTALSVVIVRNTPFEYSQEVNVWATIDDGYGEYGRTEYRFLTIPDPDVEAPIVTSSPRGGLYNHSVSVTLTSNEPSHTTIYYTTNGSIPNLSSLTYSVPIAITAEGKTVLKFIAVDHAHNSTPVIEEDYVLDTVAPISSASPTGSSFFNHQEVILSSNDSTAAIHYTTNGQDPTLSSPIYTTPISIRDNHSTVIKFFAIDQAGNQEVFHVETYSIEISKNNYIPTNVFVTCPFNQNELHIRWDDMYPIWTNIVGYNVYRAHTEMGPYEKLNKSLITVTQYQDKTLDTEIIKEDVSEQFRRTVSISKQVNDTFDRTGVFDKTKWMETDFADLLFQYNGVIFKDGVGLSQESKLTSIFKLRGNFEIKIDYDLLKWLVPNSGIESSIFRVKKDDQRYVQISRDRSPSLNLYSTNQFINGNPDLPISSATVDEFGTYRIVRSGSIITTSFYDKNASVFVDLGSYDGYKDFDMYVEIVGRSTTKTVELRWSNFELVSGNPIIIEPINPRKEYLIQASKIPIVNSLGLNVPTDDATEVSVTIDGKQAYIRHLQGIEGVIELETQRMYDEIKRQYFEPPVPNEFSKVLITYKTPAHTTNIRLRKQYFYRVTSVTNEDETDIDLVSPEVLKPEKMTYIYEEAVRRNAWLLDQAGERVLLYIKKRAGVRCHCSYRDLKARTHKHPDQDCDTCFGSSFVGGFDGPYPIIIAPLTTEQRIQQSDRGLKLAYQIETWLGPVPIVSQRDMIIRRNGDRCLVGPITPVEGPGGVRVQQHFIIEILDGTDIRYKFKVLPLPDMYHQPGIDKSSQNVLDGALNVATVDSPKEREELFTSEDRISHENDNVDHIVKGRSLSFESTEY